MKTSSKINQGIPTLKPGRDITASVAQDFNQALVAMVKRKPQALVVDFDGVEMIDSVGLGVLVGAINSLSKHGGELRLIHVSEQIHELLILMRLDRRLVVEGPSEPTSE